MRQKSISLIFCLLFSAVAFISNAETVVAVQNGPWFASDTWSCKRMPARTDAVIIPQGIMVSVTQPLYLGPTENGKPLVIAVAGTLNISSASIHLDPIDRIMVMPGGKITTKSLGGMVFSGAYGQYLEGGTGVRGPITLGDAYSISMINDITAESDEDGVTVAWRSGSEIEVNYYHVLRSVDGITYEPIGKVDGRGSKKQKLFSFVDSKAPGGTVHYRVDLTNMNGVGGAAGIVEVVVGR
ncbi:MAG TPA: hypothetical protein VFE50_26175 [Cyclobacteriaceae bacterium]|nr:hypothetical protein [Cyclobacteriaceae bacterium]